MIVYFDTSALLKLILEDERGTDSARDIWSAASYAVCAEVGYAEARAALAAAFRAKRLDVDGFSAARRAFEEVWDQMARVAVDEPVARAAGDLAESDALRGYDAIHLAAAIAAGADVFVSSDARLLAAADRNGLGTADPAASP